MATLGVEVKRKDPLKDCGEVIEKACPLLDCNYTVKVGVDYAISCKDHNRLMILKKDKDEFVKQMKLAEEMKKKLAGGK